MRKVTLITQAVVLAPVLAWGLGCNKASQDSSPVIANVGGQKITQKEFEDTIRSVVTDAAKAEQVLHADGMRDQRNGFLGNLAQQKAVMELARMEGLDRDAKVRLAADEAVAQVYLKAILDKRAGSATPTDADLKKLYDEVVAKQKASGNPQPAPPFEMVKSQLAQMWQQKQEQQNQARMQDELAKELKVSVPITYAEDYQPKQMAPN